MFISIFRKIRIRAAASYDANGVYGQYLLKRQSKSEKTDILYPSLLMEYLATSYSSKCKKIIAHRTDIHRLYSKILREYAELSSIMEGINEEEEKIKDQIEKNGQRIEEYQETWNKLQEHWNSVNQTGIISPEMHVSNMGELKKNIDEIKNKLSKLESESIELRSNLDLVIEGTKEQKEKVCTHLRKLILHYECKIKVLYGELKNIGGKYEEYFAYYWYLLCKRLEKNKKSMIIEYSKSFSEVCRICNVQFIQMDELFCEERQLINTTISSAAGIEIEANLYK